ncbi:MAG: hypothetical protein ACD_81C00186G0003 [uncultured bacterium]|uniref:Uncharacterized protein n=2 Tax=Candidatus Wolfeibacteriota TaxID=1752735 RepID=A0A0G1H8R2_9BACT|nr:MAG: hypothetical protein ACD_81C00186G0003 [uncultured bacterium]KKR12825.1 MAG: hypothetical protein UT41_C0001G0369 [Candidatus Wolfebacteria bacterium GW2011_GWC2_39_22]KKT43756.1 MAG: hypothetical protein UW32_C0001G0348 [Candidatus Wolfebacteria bacterium GW2011_GWE2_44_13]HBI25513.1 hypothetical protein [Candidatus Wolfebacteria bacterium]
MIGNPKWFSRRKYTGWGFTPKTWQGWVYIAVIMLPIAIVASVNPEGTWTSVFLIIWALVFAVDFIHIMVGMRKDERERIHEAIAERNALWAILAVLIFALAYQTASGIAAHALTPTFDPFILAAIIAAVIAKAATNIYLDRKN